MSGPYDDPEVDASQAPTGPMIDIPPPGQEAQEAPPADPNQAPQAWLPAPPRAPRQLVQSLLGYDDAGQPIYGPPQPKQASPMVRMIFAAVLGVAGTMAVQAMAAKRK